MRNRGSAAVLAMIFLVVFGALSCAFYVMISASMQVSRNDRDSLRARAAAESGMDVIKHHLSRAQISEYPSSTPDISVIRDDVFGTPATFSTPATAGYLTNTTDLSFPDTWYQYDAGALSLQYPELKVNAVTTLFEKPRTFTAYLTVDKNNTVGRKIDVAVDGFDHQSGVKRSMAASFYARPTGRGIFDYDLASAGRISLRNADIKRVGVFGRTNVMSLSDQYPSIVIDGSSVTGGLGVVESGRQVELDRSVSVNGITDPDVIKSKVTVSDPQPLPMVKATDFLNIVPLTTILPSSLRSGITLTNTIIAPARSSSTVTRIAGGATLNGIIYVKSPNKLEFGGSVTLNGIIVFEPPNGGDGTYQGDSLTFTGNLTQNALAAAPYLASNPKGMEYIAGDTILAPAADVSMSGSSGSQVQGSIICYTFTGSNAAFDLNINNGAILTVSKNANAFNLGQGKITFTRTSLIPPTYGIYYTRQYVMDPRTYEERFQ